MTHYAGMIATEPHAVAAALAAQLVVDIQKTLEHRATARVVFSTGATPVATYAALRDHHRAALPWDRVCVQQLDEYCGLAPDDALRFSAFLREHLVQPLGTQFQTLTGAESAAALSDYDSKIAGAGGLDVVLFGVGVNGHLGFNEPGSSFVSATRRIALHASTRERIWVPPHGVVPQEAVTLGLATLCAARRVRVVALGAAKRDALTRGLLTSPSTDVPLSSLQGHPDVQFFLDAAAAPEGLTFRASV